MKNGKFELHVCVGGKPLQEIKSETGETWVEASFKTDATYYSKPATEVDPHGETYEATWYGEREEDHPRKSGAESDPAFAPMLGL